VAHEYLTSEQAAEICHVDPETVRRWIRSGRLPASPPVGGSGRRLVRRDVLDRFLAPQGEAAR
jgi:excisionase family DNA binding protein